MRHHESLTFPTSPSWALRLGREGMKDMRLPQGCLPVINQPWMVGCRSP